MWEKCPNPKCEATNVRRIIAPPSTKDGKLYCPACYHTVKRGNCHLGKTVEKWVDADGKTRRVTYGKAWEIEHRRLSPEDKMTVINYATGKETQY